MVKIFILAGQSNMAGAAITSEIPEELKTIDNDVKVFEDGKMNHVIYKDRFGPEFGFAKALEELMPNEEIVLCKTACGGANLFYDWNPDGVSQGEEDSYRGPLYPKLIENIKALKKHLATEGKKWEFVGALWMQGERDSIFEFMAEAYKTNMINFIAKLRSDVNSPEMPFVIGKIAPRKFDIIKGTFNHQYRNQVRFIQDELGKEENVLTVETIDLPQSDNLHFDTAGMIELGKRFADKIML